MFSKTIYRLAQLCEEHESTIADLEEKLKTAQNREMAAIQAGIRLELRLTEDIDGKQAQINDIASQRNTYKNTLALKDMELNELREELHQAQWQANQHRENLEDAHGVIAQLEAALAERDRQISALGDRLDAHRQKRKGHAFSAPAHGSVSIDSPHHKDNCPRN